MHFTFAAPATALPGMLREKGGRLENIQAEALYVDLRIRYNVILAIHHG